eukprot:1178669-Prorocentrum_minimum.AAC.2
MCEASFAKTAAVAGDALAVKVELADKFGNRLSASFASPEGGRPPEVVVTAKGPETVTLVSAGGKGGSPFEAPLSRAGTYVVQALVDGQGVGGWPRVVSVSPGAVAASRSLLGGAALAGPLVCGKPSLLVVHAADSFGNSCAEGGEEVTVVIKGPGSEPVEAAVTDCKDGSYTADVTVERAGEYNLMVTVGGKPVKSGGQKVSAVYGPPTAKDLVVTPPLADKAVCGTKSKVQVRCVGAGGDARTLDGTEGLGLSLVAPSGASRKVDLELKEEGAYAEWSVEWVEAGRHTLNVTLAGEHVKGSPATVEAEAQTLCLANSAMAGAGLHGCTAGERA